MVVGIKPPPTHFLAIFDPWGGFIPHFAGVGLCPHLVIWGVFITLFRVVLSPFLGDFIPLLGGGGGGWFYATKAKNDTTQQSKAKQSKPKKSEECTVRD